MEDQDPGINKGLLGFLAGATAMDMHLKKDYTPQGAMRGFNRACKLYLLVCLAWLVIGLTVLVSTHLINSAQDAPYRAFDKCLTEQVIYDATKDADTAACQRNFYPGGIAKAQADINARQGYYAY